MEGVAKWANFLVEEQPGLRTAVWRRIFSTIDTISSRRQAQNRQNIAPKHSFPHLRLNSPVSSKKKGGEN